MRFVSKYQRYSLQIHAEKKIVTIDGHSMVSVEQLLAEFEHGMIWPHEIDVALSHFRFQGLPDGLDGAYRLSVFDTDWAAKQQHWTPETKEEVERKLLDNQSRDVDYILVEKVKIKPPWPNYDQLRMPNKIAAKVLEDGFDLEEVIAYERDNQNREDVLEALESLRPEPAEEPLEVLA